MKSSRVLIAGALGASLVGCSTAQVKPDAVAMSPAKPVKAPKSVAPVQTPAAKPELARAAPAQQVQLKSEDPFAAGLVAFDAGKLDEAADRFHEALEKDPKNVRAQHNLGVIAWRKGELDAAQKAFEDASRLDPKFAPSVIQLARLYRARNQGEQEVALLEKTTASGPLQHDASVLDELATAYRLQKNFTQAEAVCRSVLARSKDDVDALKALSRIYFDQANYRLAGVIAAKVAKVAPQDASAHNDLGMIALQLGDTPIALAEFQKAVDLDPKFEPGFLNLGAIALRYRDYQNAEKAFAQAAAIAPKDAKAQLAYAWALDGERMQDASKAGATGAAYEKAIALSPDAGDAVCGAAWAYAADPAGTAKAKTFLERCKALDSTSADDKKRIDQRLQAIAARESAPKAPTEVGATGVGQAKDGAAAGNPTVANVPNGAANTAAAGTANTPVAGTAAQVTPAVAGVVPTPSAASPGAGVPPANPAAAVPVPPNATVAATGVPHGEPSAAAPNPQPGAPVQPGAAAPVKTAAAADATPNSATTQPTATADASANATKPNDAPSAATGGSGTAGTTPAGTETRSQEAAPVNTANAPTATGAPAASEPAHAQVVPPVAKGADAGAPADAVAEGSAAIERTSVETTAPQSTVGETTGQLAPSANAPHAAGPDSAVDETGTRGSAADTAGSGAK